METGFLKYRSAEVSAHPVQLLYSEVTRKNMVREIDSMEASKRPFIVTRIAGMDVKWLLDTGAEISVLDEEVFHKVKKAVVKKLPMESVKVQSASGHAVPTLGTVVLNMEIGRKIVQVPTVIVKGLKTRAILGMDFMSRAGIQLDLGKLKESNPIMVETIAKENCNLIVRKECIVPPSCIQKVKVGIHDWSGKRVEDGVTGYTVNSEKDVYITEALCKAKEGGTTFTLVVNPGMSQVVLKRGAVIGEFHPVRQEDCVELNEVMKQMEKKGSSPGISKRKMEMIMKETNIGGNEEFQRRCKALLVKYHECISEDKFDIGGTNIMPHQIQVRNKEPIHVKQFRIPWDHREFLDDFVAELLKKGCIQASRSPYNAPIFCVKKPHGGGLRVVQDFRHLNMASLDDKYVIREIQDCIDEIGRRKSEVFSTLDLTSGFWQQTLHEDSRKLTAFTVPGRGRFEWVRMPMGLHGSPSSFARLMDHVMQGQKGVITYIDDVLTHSPDLEEHLEDLEGCLERLKSVGLKINLKKCAFAAARIPYLGYTLTKNGVLPGEEKMKAVKSFPEPATVKQIREFTGLANYFRHMIPGYSLLAGHLTQLTTKETPWKGGALPEKARQAFQILKERLCQAPVLAYPRKDRMFVLATDAATGDKDNPGGLGAVLSQTDEKGQERVIAYASRSLKDHEKNYGAFLLEMAAASWAIDHFSVYLTGRRFVLLTDHKPLVPLNTRQQKTFNRLQQQLCEYNFIIRYREGGKNQVPDALSRNPVDEITVLPTFGLTDEQMIKMQRTDVKCQLVLKFLRYGGLPNKKDMASSVMRWARNAIVKDDLLYMGITKEEEVKPLLWVPRVYQGLIMKAAHCHAFAGHGGRDKTMSRLRMKYWWPGQVDDVDKFIKQCVTCQGSKDPKNFKRQHAPQVAWETPDQPNIRVHADLFGPLKTSGKGNKFVLVITDAFSKYTVVVAIPNKEAETVSEAIFQHWIVRFSCPKMIVTDNGKEFANKIADKLYKRLGIEHRKTSVCHPQTNSAAESFNRTVIKYMKRILENDSLDWEPWLGPLMISYNTQVHRATRVSPYFLTYGMDPRLPFFDLDNPRVPYNDDWAEDVFLRAREAWRQARINIEAMSEKQQEYAKETEKERQLEVGQMVFVLRPSPPPGSNGKFIQQWEGGYVISAKAGPVTYVVYNCKTGRSSFIHIDRLKAVVKRETKEMDSESEGSGDEMYLEWKDTRSRRPNQGQEQEERSTLQGATATGPNIEEKPEERQTRSKKTVGLLPWTELERLEKEKRARKKQEKMKGNPFMALKVDKK